ncbi:MAG TPA: type II toxin-antitoxin system VapC family toxin, partial [Planctomycetaceae bacterium]|nr:type II toxin-antitoxin system VapC family toxin [Planctomycetaceae bacterium]
LSELISESNPGEQLKSRLAALHTDIATSIVAFEELLRGWLAKIHREPKPQQQVTSYRRLFKLLNAFASWEVLVWDEDCVEIYERLIKQRVNVKPMDLKIAAIAILNDATLLSRNLKDFERVPGLIVEDWLS